MNTSCTSKNFSIKAALSFAFKALIKHWLLLAKTILLVPALLLSLSAIVNLTALLIPSSLIVGLMLTLGIIVLIPLLLSWLVGINRILLDIHDYDRSKLVRVIPSFRLVIKTIMGFVLYKILISIGSFFLIIPGLILGVQYRFFYLPFLDNDRLGIWKAFRYSNKLTRGVGLKLFFYTIIPGITSLIFGFGFFMLTLLCLMTFPNPQHTAPLFIKEIQSSSVIVPFILSIFFNLLFRLATIHIYRSLEDFENNKELNERPEPLTESCSTDKE